MRRLRRRSIGAPSSPAPPFRRMTNANIAYQRLRNQYLSEATFTKPQEVVQWLVAVQAQDFAGAKWSLGLRMQGATDDKIEQAFADGSILRTHLMRPTWHFVTPDDIRWMLALTAPRVHVANAFMYRKLELDQSIFTRSNDALGNALQGGKQLIRNELRDVLDKAGIATAGEFRMGYLMMQAELEGIVCSGARRGKQFTYALLDERAPHARVLDREEALAELARRYFISRGPATVQDFAKWSGLTIADARSGLEAIKGYFQQEVVEGQTYWFALSAQVTVTGDEYIAEVTVTYKPTAHLLSIYDEYISSYKDRSAIGDGRYAERLMAMGNALTYILIVDSQIVGTWKRTLKKDAVVIETNLFTALTEAENLAVAVAAQQYRTFLELPVVLA